MWVYCQYCSCVAKGDEMASPARRLIGIYQGRLRHEIIKQRLSGKGRDRSRKCCTEVLEPFQSVNDSNLSLPCLRRFVLSILTERLLHAHGRTTLHWCEFA